MERGVRPARPYREEKRQTRELEKQARVAARMEERRRGRAEETVTARVAAAGRSDAARVDGRPSYMSSYTSSDSVSRKASSTGGGGGGGEAQLHAARASELARDLSDSISVISNAAAASVAADIDASASAADRLHATDERVRDVAVTEISDDAATSAAAFLDAAAARDKKDAIALADADQPELAVTEEEYEAARRADEKLADTVRAKPTTLAEVAAATHKSDKGAETAAKRSADWAGWSEEEDKGRLEAFEAKQDEKREMKLAEREKKEKLTKAKKAKKRIEELEAELAEARRTVAAAGAEEVEAEEEEAEEAEDVVLKPEKKKRKRVSKEATARTQTKSGAQTEEDASTSTSLERVVAGLLAPAEASMGAAPVSRASPAEKYGGARLSGNAAASSASGTVDVPMPPPVFRNRFGAIPGLLEHVQRRAAALEAMGKQSEGVSNRGDKLRFVTYANAAYWPVAKVLIASIAHNAPAILPRLTVMLTNPADVKECGEMASTREFDCFYDEDMVEILGDVAHQEGSLLAAGISVPPEKHAEAEKLGMALRIVWCWRKVHAVYTLVKGGYPTVFLDASTVLLNDPRETITKHFGSASLVTLSDFGGSKEQKSINTGLVAAPTGRATEELLEEWMKLEEGATETEQAYLTWDLAPRLRKEGTVIYALPHRNFPSYITFDGRHVKGTGSSVKPKDKKFADVLTAGASGAAGAEAIGGAEIAEASLGESRGLTGADAVTAGDAGFTVHAAYCGSVKGKLAFLTRVEAMARAPGALMPPQRDELEGCDTYDRDKYLKCGNAPWDGDC